MMRKVNTTPNGFPPVDSKKQEVSLYQYLMENDIGIKRMSYFADFYKVIVNDLSKFVPSSGLVNTGQCGRFGNNYAIFLKGGGSVTLNLSGVDRNFNVERLDIRSGTTAKLNRISGGDLHTIDSGISSDAAILIISKATSVQKLKNTR